MTRIRTRSSSPQDNGQREPWPIFWAAFAVIQLAFFIWIADAWHAIRPPANCGSLDLDKCRTAAGMGTVVGALIGVAVVAGIWFIQAVVLLLGRCAVLLERHPRA